MAIHKKLHKFEGIIARDGKKLVSQQHAHGFGLKLKFKFPL